MLLTSKINFKMTYKFCYVNKYLQQIQSTFI